MALTGLCTELNQNRIDWEQPSYFQDNTKEFHFSNSRKLVGNHYFAQLGTNAKLLLDWRKYAKQTTYGIV